MTPFEATIMSMPSNQIICDANKPQASWTIGCLQVLIFVFFCSSFSFFVSLCYFSAISVTFSINILQSADEMQPLKDLKPDK